ncbi:hypothetical protein K469DRAFT_744161 [Zopfia rhizophila CBS 207.26]|uniref:Uncharacterized protein n=1 Tax=Zopfia rhizophila CBS 207.26 TaxID=1314779 RepID=A0A6A6EU33_9PEZI|nr:hypothetical protein K469DRAFT_744161 [Zopfia rhizophila CBS 207.26]
MVSVKATLIAVAALAGVVTAAPAPASAEVGKLDKPVIQPPMPELGEYLRRKLPASIESIKRWPGRTPNGGILPANCKQWFKTFGYDPVQDVEVYNVTYSDVRCPKQPWVMCRHKNAPFNNDTMARSYGKIPPVMRSYTRHFILLPASNHGGNSAINSGDDVIIQGNVPFSGIVASVAHSVDIHGFPVIGPFHNTQEWLDAYNKDSAVCNNIAAIDQVNNVAQTTVVALFDTVDSIKTLYPNSKAIANQYTTIQSKVHPGVFNIKLGAKCSERLPNSLVVPSPDEDPVVRLIQFTIFQECYNEQGHAEECKPVYGN